MPSQPIPGSRPGSSSNHARNTLIALRLGITLLASLGGAVAYFGLTEMGVNDFLAVLLGLGFALLARQAASSLFVDALVRRARQARAETDQYPPRQGPGAPADVPRP